MRARKILVKYKEILLYFFFGVSTTVVNWMVYFLFSELFRTEMTMSNAVAWMAAVIFAFVTNKLFVFESNGTSLRVMLKEGISFLGVRFFSGLFEILLPTRLFEMGLNQPLFGIAGGWAKAIISVLVILSNYILSKVFVFKKDDGGIRDADDEKRTIL